MCVNSLSGTSHILVITVSSEKTPKPEQPDKLQAMTHYAVFTGGEGQTTDLPINKLELYKPKVTCSFMQQTYTGMKDEKEKQWAGCWWCWEQISR